jgi:hypothetical protein
VAFGGASLASGGSAAFGTHDNGLHTAKTFTIANTGTAALAIASVTISGADAGLFAITSPASSPVAIAGSTDLVITFTSDVDGAKAAVLTINSDDPAMPAFTANLTGAGITPVPGTLWYVKQAMRNYADSANTYSTSIASPSAVMSSGTITFNHHYSSSNNVFYTAQYGSPAVNWNYSNNNASFLVFPTKLSGDFSITATVRATSWNSRSGAAEGVGVGMFSGFQPTDSYVMNLANTASTQQIYSRYTTAASPFYATNGTAVAWGLAADYTITFRRSGDRYYFTANPAGSAANAEQSNFLSATTGCAGEVYVGLAFGNIAGTARDIVIRNADGNAIYDSATGNMAPHILSSLALSAATATVDISNAVGTTVTATALADGGTVAGVDASSSNTGVCTVSVANGATNSTVTILPVGVGNATVTVTNQADPAKVRTIAVTVTAWSTSDPYGALTTVYPADGAIAAYPDGELSITFDNVPTLNAGGSIYIYTTAATPVLTDTIAFANETDTVASALLNVGDQLVRVSGNTLYFKPHVNKLLYGTSYYVAIPTTSISANLNGMAFNGLTNVYAANPTWGFTTRAAPTLSASSVTVDSSQLGDASTVNFRSIQKALDYLNTGLPAATAVRMDLAAGTYRELVRYTGTKDITLAGPAANVRGSGCDITWRNYDGLNTGTAPRPVMYFNSCNLVMEHLTVTNTWTRTVGVNSQAETIYFAGGAARTFAASKCSFISNQDTIQTSGRTWLYDCYVQGNTDYVWGTAPACLIEGSNLYCKNDGYAGSSLAYLFVARTGSTLTPGVAGTVGKGFVLLNSTVTVDDGMTAYFGRDAGAGAFYDQVALVNVACQADAGKSATGVLGAGLWSPDAYLYYAGYPNFVGWKTYNVTGLTAASDTPRANAAVLDGTTYTDEFSTRNLILNRVVSFDGSAFSYAAAGTTWDLSALQTQFGL